MFKGCPFGLKPISSTFQRVVNYHFKDIKYVTAFVDDIVIFSRDLPTHTQHVQETIRGLTEVNLILNPDKCHFAQRSVYLLGFRVSGDGIAPDPRKVFHAQEWPRPITGRQIQSSLGLINYFREHVAKVSELSAPLDKLRLVNNLDSVWTDEHTQAFESLKSALRSAPIFIAKNETFLPKFHGRNSGGT